MTSPLQPGELGGRAAKGFAWLGVQSVVEKFASGIGQIALAWLLLPGAFKLVGLTYTITVFASLLQSAGVREVLQQRQKRLDVWATPAFWLSLTIGLVSAVAVVGIAPWASRFYAEPGLEDLLFVSAAILPLSSMGVVPEVILRSRMQFRFIATAGSIVLLGQMVLSIAFAALGLGAMSIILPQPILALVRLIMYWRKARPSIRHGPRPSRWRYLLGDSSAVLVGSLAFMATFQGGQMILGRLFPLSAAAGIFYFCTVLADQSVRVLVNNLGGVLLPALAKIQDDRERLAKALTNVTGLLLLVGVPVCALQATLAAPLIRLVFPERWHPAIGCFAVLSVAAIGRLIHCPGESVLIARGRFRTYMSMALGYAALFLSAMYIAATNADQADIAAYIAGAGGVCTLIMGPVAFILAMEGGRAGPLALARLLAVPLLATIISLIPAGTMLYAMPHTIAGDAATILLGSLACGAIYLPLVRLLSPAMWNQLAVRIAAVAPVRFRPAVSRIIRPTRGVTAG